MSEELRFLFMGTGTSAGVPMIGCSCAVCTSSDPRDSRLRTAGAVMFRDSRGQDRTVLLDCGPDLRVQALRANLGRCDAIVFTHNHVDHTFGLDEVRRFNVVQKAPIELHADTHTMEHLRRVYKHIFDRHQNVNDSFVADLMPRLLSDEQIERGEPLDLWGVAFTPIPLLHGRLPVLGWRIERAAVAGGPDAIPHGPWSQPAPSPTDHSPAGGASPGANPPNTASPQLFPPGAVFPLAYCTDVSAIPPKSWERLTGLKTLVLDALRHRHHPTHLTLEQAVNIADRVGAERTYFVHMAHDLPHGETQASLPEGVFLAWDGLEIA